MGALTTESLIAAVADSLSWLGDYGFAFFKSRREFRRVNKNATSRIVIQVVTRNGIGYSVAFYLYVQIPAVELWLLKLKGVGKKLRQQDVTITNYTVNIGPGSPHWDYPTRGSWYLCDPCELDDTVTDISGFVENLAVPFVLEHQIPETVRQTLIDTPGHASTHHAYEKILAIDCLYNTPEQLDADIETLNRRYAGYSARPRQDFSDFVSAISLLTGIEGRRTPSDGAEPSHQEP